MRFVIAGILVLLYIVVSLATSKGIEGVYVLVGFVAGGILAAVLVAALFCIPKSGRNNKRFFRAFNIVLFLSILGQGEKLMEVIAVSQKPPQTITLLNNQATVVVPGSWVVNEPPNEKFVLSLSDGSGYLNILISFEYAGDDRLQLEHYAQFIGNNFKETAPDFKSMSDIKKCNSTKLKCVYRIANTTNGDKGTKTVLASLSAEEGYYNFIAITNPGLFETYKDDIFGVLESLDESNN